MLRTVLLPALAFLSGLGALKAAIPLQSLTLMAVGLSLSCFGLLRLILRDPGKRLHHARRHAAPAPASPARRPWRPD
jgi:hypothetical protein